MKLLNKNIVKKLTKKKLKISFAESCTGGLLSSAITSVNGSSKVFNLGLVVYSNESKIKVLGVSKKIIRKFLNISLVYPLFKYVSFVPPPPRVFGHNSLPRALVGTRIGGNCSYKPPGAP